MNNNRTNKQNQIKTHYTSKILGSTKKDCRAEADRFTETKKQYDPINLEKWQNKGYIKKSFHVIIYKMQ